MLELTKKYNLDSINYLKQNKSKITEEILSELRSFGLAGKQIALGILELEKDENIQDIHCIEIQKCREDLFYFKDNYLLVLNKDDLQDKMIKGILTNKKVQLTSGKGTKKTYAAVIYALWIFNFKQKNIIGIAADKTVWCKEFISNATNLYNQLPTWMQIPARNLKTTMTSKTGNKLVIDRADKNIFRGMSLNNLIIEASSHISQDNFKNTLNNTVPCMLQENNSKVIVIEPHMEVTSDFIEINEFSEFREVPIEPVKTVKPVLKRTFKQIIKDIIESLYNKIKG